MPGLAIPQRSTIYAFFISVSIWGVWFGASVGHNMGDDACQDSDSSAAICTEQKPPSDERTAFIQTQKVTTKQDGADFQERTRMHSSSHERQSNIIVPAELLASAADLETAFQTKSSLCTAACICILAMLAPLWRYSLETRDAKATGEERALVLDNVRVWGAAMVIWGHVVYYNLGWDKSIVYHDTETWLKGFNAIGSRVLEYTSVVKMPALCFVSGYLSKGPPSSQRIRRYVQQLVIPTLLWLFLGKPLLLPLMMEPSMNMLREKLFALVRLELFKAEWYLQALCLWRASAYLLWCHLRPSVALLGMLFVSCVAGYAHYDGFAAYLQLGPTLGFLPYFAAGYTFPVTQLLRIGSSWRSPLTSSLAFAFVIVWIVWLMPMMTQGPLPDGHGSYSCCAAGGMFRATTSVDHALYWTRRVVKFGVEMVPTLILIVIVTPEGDMCGLSWIGRHTMYPFVLHYAANHWRDRFIQALPLPIITCTSGHALVLLLHLGYAVCVQALLSTTIVRQCFGWCFNPTWTEALFAACPPLSQEHQTQLQQHKSHQTESSHPPKHDQQSRHVQQAETQPYRSRSASPAGSGISGSISSTSTPSTASLQPYLHPQANTFHNCDEPIPGMQDARFFYPMLLPLYLVLVAGIVGTFVIMSYRAATPAAILEFACMHFELPLCIMALGSTAFSLAVYAWHIKRLSAAVEPPSPLRFAGEPLRHVVVVLNYKEPLSVLRRTFATITAQEHLAMPPSVVLACEDRDQDATKTFQCLSEEFGDALQELMLTKHVLQAGEVAGKSSNENWAVRQLYKKLVDCQGLDPFSIMITICDADSLLSTLFLAQLEASFWEQRDGRRLIYSSPLNVYRNLGATSPLIQMYDMLRSHNDAFYNPWRLYQPQSNYSLLLGFAQEIGFWTPDNIPEDVHTCRRAQINNMCSMTTVPIGPYIVNDLVENFGDRYVQAKRHRWGITEFAWVCSMYRYMPFQAWLHLMAMEACAGTFFEEVLLLTKHILRIAFLASMWVERHSRHYGICIYLILFAWVFSWLVFWIAESILWRNVLSKFPIEQPSRLSWIFLLMTGPLLQPITDLLFHVVPTWDCLIHMNVVGELQYVNAPKGAADDRSQSS